MAAARASLPTGLWFRSAPAPAAALAPLLSACAQPGAAARATVPRGPGTKVAMAIAGGGAGALAGSYLPAHQPGLAAGPAARCHRARHRRGSARPQSKSRARCLWPASFVSNSRRPPPATASPQRHGVLVKPRTRRSASTERQPAVAEAEQGLATLTQQGRPGNQPPPTASTSTRTALSAHENTAAGGPATKPPHPPRSPRAPHRALRLQVELRERLTCCTTNTQRPAPAQTARLSAPTGTNADQRDKCEPREVRPGMKQEKEPAVTASRGTESKKPAAVPAARARQRELRAPGNIRAFTVCDTAERSWCQF